MLSRSIFYFFVAFVTVGVTAAAVLPKDAAKNLPQTPLSYKVGYFDQTLSHFHNTAFYKTQTFKQKYLINDDFFDAEKGNIFFYCGGESAIEGAWNHSRFVLDIAQNFSAMLLFVEHRFYGSSLPAGPENSFKPPYTDLLTVEQALADYAAVLNDIIDQYKAKTTPVIAFGGSYPGVLAAYFRIRYPQFVDGALAASAPLYTVSSSLAGRENNNTFFEVITKVADEGVPGCSAVIRKNYAEIAELYATERTKEIEDAFQLCKPIATPADYKQFLGFIQNAWASMAMGNYPFPANFVGPMPAFPINATCKQAAATQNIPMAGLSFSTHLFYNSTGTKACFDSYADYYFCSDPTGCGLGNDARSWDLQACSELGLGAGPTNVTDMFAPLIWTSDDRTAYCSKTWGTVFDNKRLRYQFEEADFSQASRIIFSNGLLDPWWTGGIRQNMSDSIIALLIPQAAHHLDLWGATDGDPQSVIDARNTEIGFFKLWTNDQVRDHKKQRVLMVKAA